MLTFQFRFSVFSFSFFVRNRDERTDIGVAGRQAKRIIIIIIFLSALLLVELDYTFTVAAAAVRLHTKTSLNF